MENYQNMKDQMPGGITKLTQQKSNPLPPRGVATKSDVGKSPNYKQFGGQNSKNGYDYDIEDEQNPFQSGKNSQTNKMDNQNKVLNNNNTSIYRQPASNGSRTNSASYNKFQYNEQQDDEQDDEEYGYENNPKYSAENYSHQQSKKPATSSSTQSKGQRSSQPIDQRAANRRGQQEQNEDEEEYEDAQNKFNQKNSVNNKYNQPKDIQRNTNKYNRNDYDDQDQNEEQEQNKQKQSRETNRRVSSINKRDSEQQGKETQQNNRMMQRYQKVEEGLTECPEGCGRTFNEFALEKHVKVCKKVFQDKRQAFDITQKRQQSLQNEQVQQDDEQRRKEIMKKQKEMHECPDCGRSFRYEVFEKHIKICVKVFTKKNRENSLNRKTSLNSTGQNNPTATLTNLPSKLPPQPSLTKKVSSIGESESDPKNMKKPPLKRNPSSNDKKDEPKKQAGKDYDETPIGGNKQQHSWEDTPVGGGSSNKNAWEEYPVGAGSKQKKQQWDEYPQESSTPSVHSRTTAAQSETNSNPWESRAKTKKVSQPPQQRKPWNDDWNSTTVDDNNDKDNQDDYYNSSSQNQQERKNYNFNKNIKKNTQTNSKFQNDSPSYGNHDEQNDNQDEYIYSKPNIGKKIIHSAKKSPLPESSKMKQQQQQNKYNDRNQFEDEEEEDGFNNYKANQAANRNKPYQNKFDKQNYQQEDETSETSSQHSKPFLKKSQANQIGSRGKPTQSNSNTQQGYDQQNRGNNDPYTSNNRGVKQPQQQFKETSSVQEIPINTNNEFNRQLMEMEREVVDDSDFIECPEGCGRKFAEHALEKHVRICKKVFQQKRKVFNSAAYRQVPDQEGGGGGSSSSAPIGKPTQQRKPPQQPKKQTPVNKPQQERNYNDNYNYEQPQISQKQNKQPQNPFDKKQTSENTQVGKKKPSWKLQSEAFRAVMRAGKGAPTSEYDNQIIKEAMQRDDYVQCEYCSRKFNETAAQRHIPFCKTKSQQNQIKQGGKATLKTQNSFTPSNRKY